MKTITFADELAFILNNHLTTSGGRVGLSHFGRDRLKALCANLVLNQNQEYNQATEAYSNAPVASPFHLGNTEPEFVPATNGLSHSQLSQKYLEKKYEIEELQKLVNTRDKTINSLDAQCKDLSERLGKLHVQFTDLKHAYDTMCANRDEAMKERNVLEHKLRDISSIVSSEK